MRGKQSWVSDNIPIINVFHHFLTIALFEGITLKKCNNLNMNYPSTILTIVVIQFICPKTFYKRLHVSTYW